MRITFIGVAISISLLSSQSLLAQFDPDDPEVAHTIRAKYVQSADMPDGLAFYTMMKNLSIVSAEDRGSAVLWIQEDMGLSISESEQFLNHMINTLDLLETDHDNLTRDLACPTDRAPPIRDEIYPVFEAIDDAKTTLGAQYLAMTMDEVGEEKAEKLQGWVRKFKFQVTHVSFRHKEHWEQTGGNVDEALYSICAHLNAKQRGSRR